MLNVPASRCLLMLRSNSAFSLLVNKSSVVPDIRLASRSWPLSVPEKVKLPNVFNVRFFCFSKLQIIQHMQTNKSRVEVEIPYNENAKECEHCNSWSDVYSIVYSTNLKYRKIANRRAGWSWPFLDYNYLHKKKSSV